MAAAGEGTDRTEALPETPGTEGLTADAGRELCGGGEGAGDFDENFKDDDIDEVIARRAEIYKQMEVDCVRHPNNFKRHKASSATARCYERGGNQDIEPGGELCKQAEKVIRATQRNMNKTEEPLQEEMEEGDMPQSPEDRE